MDGRRRLGSTSGTTSTSDTLSFCHSTRRIVSPKCFLVVIVVMALGLNWPLRSSSVGWVGSIHNKNNNNEKIYHYHHSSNEPSSQTNTTSSHSHRPSFAPLGKLSCPPLRGVSSSSSSSAASADEATFARVVQDMVYWRDSPKDATIQSPFANSTHFKFLTMEPDKAGFNNKRMAFETAFVIALATGRILVLPPDMEFPMLLSSLSSETDPSQQSLFGFADFFDFGKDWPIIWTMDQFLHYTVQGHVSHFETRQVTYPPNNVTNWTGVAHPVFGVEKRWQWLRDMAYTPQWTECVVVIPRNDTVQALEEVRESLWKPLFQQQQQQENKDDDDDNHNNKDHQLSTAWVPNPLNASALVRLRHMVADRDQLCMYNRELHNRATVLHLQGTQNSGHRLLVPFYALVLGVDASYDAWMKRVVRDRLRYRDEIQCAAARIVHALRTKARIVNRALSSSNDTVEPNPQQEDDDSFYTVHIRRGDFAQQYKAVGSMTMEEILNDNLLQWIPPGKVVYLATDPALFAGQDQTPAFLVPLERVYRVYYLHNFAPELETTVPLQWQGMVDQLVAAMGTIFVGCYYSTFSAYITRLRGYHSQVRRAPPGYETGALRNTYYYAPASMASIRTLLHDTTSGDDSFNNNNNNDQQVPVYARMEAPFWTREFPLAWTNLDP